jgi:hypothetical protein
LQSHVVAAEAARKHLAFSAAVAAPDGLDLYCEGSLVHGCWFLYVFDRGVHLFAVRSPSILSDSPGQPHQKWCWFFCCFSWWLV